MKPERIAQENNSRVPSAIKLEFVLDELHKLSISDPKRGLLLYQHISKARIIIFEEMQKCLDMGIGIEDARSEKVEAIIEDLFLTFVCQSPS
jgi:hypothetical protein